MPRGTLRNKQDCEDLIRGCLSLATGGGGGAEGGNEMLAAALDEGLPVEWVDVSEIPDDAWTCTSYAIGSIAPSSPETQAAITRLGLVDRLGHRAMEAAVMQLGKYAGVEIGAIAAAELGAGGTPRPRWSPACGLGSLLWTGTTPAGPSPRRCRVRPISTKGQLPAGQRGRVGQRLGRQVSVQPPHVEAHWQDDGGSRLRDVQHRCDPVERP
jgi:hypothetical protein